MVNGYQQQRTEQKVKGLMNRRESFFSYATLSREDSEKLGKGELLMANCN